MFIKGGGKSDSLDAIRDEIIRLQLLWDDAPVGGTIELSFQASA